VLLVGGAASNIYIKARVQEALIEEHDLADCLMVPLLPFAAVLSGTFVEET
jgi:hypothetical protein